MAKPVTSASVADVFRAVLPADCVSVDEARRRIAASDIAFEAATFPACVVMPGNEADVVALVLAARAEGVALHPRGGGWSYTAAYAPQSPRSAIVEMRGLGGVSINRAAGTATVGAGVTWSNLDDTLRAQDLRVPSFGPLSGLGAQIGATVAQDGGFFGGAGHGAVGEKSIAAVTLVDGCGELQQLTQARQA